MRYVIVSRHPAAVEFIRREVPEFADAPVLAQVEDPSQISGAAVAGNLPLHLAALAAGVWAVEFTGYAPRGAEYTLADMDAAGAVLRWYVIMNRLQLAGVDREAADGGFPFLGFAIRRAKDSV